jgi:hypothetical protein
LTFREEPSPVLTAYEFNHPKGDRPNREDPTAVEDEFERVRIRADRDARNVHDKVGSNDEEHAEYEASGGYQFDRSGHEEEKHSGIRPRRWNRDNGQAHVDQVEQCAKRNEAAVWLSQLPGDDCVQTGGDEGAEQDGRPALPPPIGRHNVVEIDGHAKADEDSGPSARERHAPEVVSHQLTHRSSWRVRQVLATWQTAESR